MKVELPIGTKNDPGLITLTTSKKAYAHAVDLSLELPEKKDEYGVETLATVVTVTLDEYDIETLRHALTLFT